MTNFNLATTKRSRVRGYMVKDSGAPLRAALAYVNEALAVFDPAHTAANHTQALGRHIKALSADD